MYSVCEKRVAWDGSFSLPLDRALDFLARATFSRYRRKRIARLSEGVCAALEVGGLWERKRNGMRLRLVADSWGSVVLFCEGKETQVLFRANSPWDKKRTGGRKVSRRKKRKEAKRRSRTARAAPHKKQKARIPPASPSRLRYECLRPQYRRNEIMWGTAVSIIAYGFRIETEAVRNRLLRSLERNGGGFAMYRRSKFSVRLDFDNAWMGDLTPVRLSCTKDNRNSVYRRLRVRMGYFCTGERKEVRRTQSSSVVLSGRAANL